MKRFLLILFFLLLGVFILRFVIGGPEDDWICDKGEWVKHGNPSSEKPITPCGKKTSLPKNKEDCLKIGGIWKKVGIFPNEVCNKKADDRGNICTDSSQCQGVCQANLTKEEMYQGMRGKSFNKKGVCSVFVLEFGCFGIVRNGRASVICMD
jgi:hypothetical protein